MSKNNTHHDDNISRLAQQLLDESVKLMIQSMPSIQKIAGQVVELVFVPKAMARQLVLAIALEAGAVTVNQIVAIFKKFYSNFSSRLRLIRQLEQEQQKVETQDEWMNIAEQIDNIQSMMHGDPNQHVPSMNRTASNPVSMSSFTSFADTISSILFSPCVVESPVTASVSCTKVSSPKLSVEQKCWLRLITTLSAPHSSLCAMHRHHRERNRSRPRLD